MLTDARWIGRDRDHVPEFAPRSGPQDLPLALAETSGTLLLRCSVDVPEGLLSATLRLTARGVYTAYLDGRRVGDDQLAPTWTDYRHRYAVQEHDVTTLLAPGPRVWAVELGTGWYSGFLGMDRGRQARHYGDHTAIRGELELRTADAVTVVRTQADGWSVADGSSVHADAMQGQMIDPRRVRRGFMTDPALADLEPAHEHPDDGATLRPQTAPPVIVRERLQPVSLDRRPSGEVVVDVGQNVVGRVRLRVPAVPQDRAGTHVHLRHGEALDPGGALYTENLRWAAAHDIAVLGTTEWVFDPEMTAHGFRYVEVTGYPEELRPDDIEVLVLGPDVAQLGTFACSDPDVRALHDNVLRTIRNNLLGAPTDCPQRDERLGWMGDANVISPTMVFAYDLHAYLDSWFHDVRSGQHPGGAFPDVAPRVVVEVEGAPGWSDAGVLVPWRLHRWHGARQTLTEHYPAMVRFAEHLLRHNPDHYRSRALSRSYGDWLNLDDPTDKALFATAYWALCLDALAGTAGTLGHLDDVHRWEATARKVRRAWWLRHGDVASGRLHQVPGGASQTALAMALMARLVPTDARRALGEQLRETVVASDGALRTGIHGTRFLLPALSDSGSLDLAYALLERRDYPSWLYAVDRGATTIWERWDGWTEHGGFQTPFMNSLDHYALGSVGEWLHEYVAGLRPGRDGYRHPVVRPYPGGGLRHASAERRTSRGTARSAWRLEPDRFEIEVSSVDGCRVHLPTTDEASVRAPTVSSPVPGDPTAVDLPGGSYTVSCTWDASWSPSPREPDLGWC